jgi:hypothetical protein
MNRGPARLPFSPLWLALDLVGIALATAGLLALTGSGARIAPALDDPQAGWALVGSGAVRAGFAAFNMLREIRARAGGR